jgi:serine/threonine protein kinase
MNTDKNFGIAFEGTTKDNVHGTNVFIAPECQQESPQPFSTKADLWSLGCVVCTLVEDLRGDVF